MWPRSLVQCVRGLGQAETDFGQTDFGHPYLTDFGQTDFGQFYCFSIFLFFKKRHNNEKNGRTSTLLGPKGVARKGAGPT